MAKEPNKGKMTVGEAGRKGGEKRREELGPEGYSQMGKKGGERTAETHGREFYEEIGHKGGERTAETHGREFYEQIGQKGGKTRGQEIHEAAEYFKNHPEERPRSKE